jgi:hypothetical protein
MPRRLRAFSPAWKPIAAAWNTFGVTSTQFAKKSMECGGK